MQTLSLPASQTAQKGLTDVANKNESNANQTNASKVDSDSGATPFQMELNKQVQAKQVQTSPSQPKKNSAVLDQTQTSQDQTIQANQALLNQIQIIDVKSALVLTDQITPALKLQAATNQIASARAKVEKTSSDPMLTSDINTSLPIDKTGVDLAKQLEPVNDKPLRSSKKDDKASTENIALNTVDTSNVAALPFVSQPDIVPLVNTNSAVLTPTAASNLTGVDVPKQALERDMNVALGNALQGKGVSIADKETVDSAGDKIADQSRWIDSVLASKAGKVASESMAAGKLMTNAISEAIAKETVASVNIQPQASQIAQINSNAINTNLAAQQIGSANTINAYPGKTGWDQAISQKIVWMVGSGEQAASITLNPPDLGPLQVVIHVHNDQANTTFISDNDEVRQALETGMSNLRDKMSESGIQLGQTNVSTSNQSQQNFQQATQNRALAMTQSNVDAPHTENIVNAKTAMRVSNGLVDTFA